MVEEWFFVSILWSVFSANWGLRGGRVLFFGFLQPSLARAFVRSIWTDIWNRFVLGYANANADMPTRFGSPPTSPPKTLTRLGDRNGISHHVESSGGQTF